MKKLLALLLSVIMGASLAVPAFAAEPEEAPVDGDGYFVDGEPASVYTPGDIIPISAILDDASIGIIGGADGPTSIITSGPINGISLEDFLALPDDTTWEDLAEQLAQQAQAQRDALKKSLGGVPDQIGVMVNGEYVKFPDAAPELVNGRTMVPVRALVEALGAEVSYQDGTVQFVMDKYAYEFTVGSAAVTVRAYDTDVDIPLGTIEMDCAPYIKDGRTYVPVRFIAEALGYEVGWDSEYETAVLLDRAALAEKYDEHFTILNKVQANRSLTVEEGKSYRADVKGSVAFTAFDTLNGSTTYKADLTGKTLLSTEAVNGTCSVSLSDNAVDAMLERVMDEYWFWDDTDEAVELLRTVLTSLKDMELIMNRDGLAWVHAPILDELGGEKNIWCGLDMGKELADALFAGNSTAPATVGAALAQLVPTDSVVMWTGSDVMLTRMAELFADESFTTSGGISTLTVTLDDLAELYPYNPYGGMDDFKEYQFTLKVDRNGGATLTCKVETEARYGTPAMRLTMDCTQNSRGANLTMTCHVANFGEMRLTLNTTQQTTGEKPAAEPPEGANVVDAPALLNGYEGSGN